MMEDALTRQTAERLIEAAIAAPSIHNSQPWQFVARPGDRVIEIYADPARTLRRGDPHGRAVHIACGSALFNLRLAIARAGHQPVARLLPSPRDPLLLASVRLAGLYRARPAERDLYAAIRFIGRGPLTRHSPRGVLVALKEAAAVEGASLRELGQADGLRILRGCAAADVDPHQAAGKRVIGKLLPRRDFSSRPGGRPASPACEPGPRLAAVSTSADDRASWLRAGQAAQRVLLLATHHGVQADLLSPALNAPGAPAHGETVLAGEHLAVILQFGSGHMRPATARRPVAQVLRVLSPVAV
jgi:nitroreductase